MEIVQILKNLLTEDEVANLLKKNVIEYCYSEGLGYVRLTQEYKGYYRGTIFYDKWIIPGYPRIPRILHLENGIKRYFKTPFYVEEKMDGYNVRVALIENKLIAFTRGGFICPFTTDRIDDLIDPEFFRKYPGYVICGEVVGPGNPYNIESTSYVSEDVAFFVFDLFSEKGIKLPPEERYRIVKEFSLREVKRWGPFEADNINEVKEIVLELNSLNREGIVIKSIEGDTAVKYVTLSSCLRDLEATTHLITELPAGFYIQRILRAIFFSHEFGIPLDDTYLLKAARALYLNPLNSLLSIRDGDEIKEVFTVKVKVRDTVPKLLKALSRAGIKTRLLEMEKEDAYYRVKFAKIYTIGSKEMRQRLRGKSFFD
jgi:putative ATP-dependent DNA ligase